MSLLLYTNGPHWIEWQLYCINRVILWMDTELAFSNHVCCLCVIILNKYWKELAYALKAFINIESLFYIRLESLFYSLVHVKNLTGNYKLFIKCACLWRTCLFNALSTLEIYVGQRGNWAIIMQPNKRSRGKQFVRNFPLADTPAAAIFQLNAVFFAAASARSLFAATRGLAAVADSFFSSCSCI